MPYTDKNGRVWPDTMQQNGINLILDPVASMAAKRPKYRPDPRERQEYAEKYGFVEKPEEPASALEGLALTGAGAATLIGGQKLGQYLTGGLEGETAKAGLSQVGQQALAGNTAAPGAAVAAPTGVEASLVEVPAAEAGMFDLAGIGSAGNVLLPALGAYGAYDLYSSNRGARNRPAGALQGLASGAAMGSYFGAPGAIVGGVLGGLYGGTQHESTKDTQKRRWGGLSEAAQGLYQANHPDGDTGTWDTGKYAGQKWTFDKALDLAKEDPTHFQGVYGNLAAVGDKYLGLEDATQKEFVRRNIAAGNYDSKKGDVIIKDKALANKILAEIEQPAASLAQAGANAVIPRPVVNNQTFRR